MIQMIVFVGPNGGPSRDNTNVQPLCPPCNGARNGNPHLY